MALHPRIHILPPLLVNRIAAGEVIERPASVVRELLDNALDAFLYGDGGVEGAGQRPRITVTIERGGLDLIRVQDNGCGMDEENLRLCVLPHATSKLHDEEDLYRIATLGFRGEALASIGAVSDLCITSRPAGQDEGRQIRVYAKEASHANAAGCPIGTTVEVRDLFRPVPARRKFLRTQATESGHVKEQLCRVALANPDIDLVLISNERTLLNLPGGNADRRRRIGRLFGEDLAEALLSIQRSERGTLLEAWFAPPALSRATAQWQYIFVNGRFIRDRYIQHSIREAYRGLIDPHRHPVVFIFLTVDPATVDVNVHPTKSEVRWEDSALIHTQILAAARDVLGRADLTASLSFRPASRSEQGRAEPADIFGEPASAASVSALVHGSDLSLLSSASAPRPQSPAWPASGESRGDTQARRAFADAVSREFAAMKMKEPAGGAPSWERAEEAAAPLPSAADPDASHPAPTHFIKPIMKVLQLHNTYLVVEEPEGVLIIDQHALHERIMYEHLKARITRGPLESQRLLLPETALMTRHEQGLLEQQRDLLTQLGIECEPFGEDAVAVHAFPSLLRRVEIPAFMRDLVDRVRESDSRQSPETMIHELLDMMACKAAVKAGDPLTQEEIAALLEQRHLSDKSSNCPHGRPTTLRLTKSDLERQFKRS